MSLQADDTAARPPPPRRCASRSVSLRVVRELRTGKLCPASRR
jgi:hypothetical protein